RGCCGNHRLKGMAERHGAQPHAVLDELVAVQIPHVTAFASPYETRREFRELVIPLRVGMRPAWDQLMRPGAQLAPGLKAGSPQLAETHLRLRVAISGHETPPPGRFPSGIR